MILKWRDTSLREKQKGAIMAKTIRTTKTSGFNKTSLVNSRNKIKMTKAANKVAYAKKKKDLKLQRMEAQNQARVAKTQLKATIRTQKASKKYGFDPSLSPELKVRLKESAMKHQTARLAATEAAGSVTGLAGGLGGASISMQQAHFGRENEPTVPGQTTTGKPSVGPQGSGSLDDILSGIGK